MTLLKTFKEYKLTELEQQEIARVIAGGCNSGLLDDEEGTRISWELKFNKWREEEE